MRLSIVELIEKVKDSQGVMIEMPTKSFIGFSDKVSKVKHAMKERDWRISIKEVGRSACGGIITLRVERKQQVQDEYVEVEHITVMEEGL